MIVYCGNNEATRAMENTRDKVTEKCQTHWQTVPAQDICFLSGCANLIQREYAAKLHANPVNAENNVKLWLTVGTNDPEIIIVKCNILCGAASKKHSKILTSATSASSCNINL